MYLCLLIAVDGWRRYSAAFNALTSYRMQNRAGIQEGTLLADGDIR